MPKHAIVRDPRLVVRPPTGPGRLVLGLDLGTTTGYATAVHAPGRPVDPKALGMSVGQWDLVLCSVPPFV